MLRQVWAERILTGTLKPSERLEKVSEEVQRIMFPGVSLDAMKTLAKNMDFLMSSKPSGAGVSMAATAHVEHPLHGIPNILGIETGKVINVAALGMGDPAARVALGAYYKLVRLLFNHPAFLRWMEKGLKGDERAREMVKAEIQRRMQQGGAAGAGAAQGLTQAPNQNLPLSSPPAQQPREQVQERSLGKIASQFNPIGSAQ